MTSPQKPIVPAIQDQVLRQLRSFPDLEAQKALFDASLIGDHQAMLAAIDAGASFESADQNGYTAAALAVSQGQQQAYLAVCLALDSCPCLQAFFQLPKETGRFDFRFLRLGTGDTSVSFWKAAALTKRSNIVTFYQQHIAPLVTDSEDLKAEEAELSEEDRIQNDLFVAAILGDQKKIVKAIRDGASFSQTDSNWKTAAELAVQFDHQEDYLAACFRLDSFEGLDALRLVQGRRPFVDIKITKTDGEEVDFLRHAMAHEKIEIMRFYDTYYHSYYLYCTPPAAS